MNNFEWASAKSVDDAVKLLSPGANANPDESPRVILGGQDLHTTIKSYITRPSRVVNLKTIPEFAAITRDASGLSFGAAATLTDIEHHADVKQLLPGLAEAIHSVATPQIRNLGTIGGNLNQRPRCWYFRLDNVVCLKRGGDTCYAKDGENKYHAVFGTDAPCVITHPSDLLPILVAADAVVHVAGPNGARQIAAKDYTRVPTADDAKRETTLKDGEFVTKVVIPVPAGGATKSTYLKFKERSSLDFAMASVAAVATPGADGTLSGVRVVLGGVAPIPWPLPAVDAFLKGKKLDEATIAKAADLAVADAKPLSQNGYKIPLLRTLVRRALTKIA